MALNIQTLKTRSLSALVFVMLMAVGILYNTSSFILLFAIIHFGCWYEFIKLMRIISGRNYWKYAGLGLIYITLPILLLILFRVEYLSYTILTNIDTTQFLVMLYFYHCLYVGQ
jgi:phosphatidate cytidylyltransferase